MQSTKLSGSLIFGALAILVLFGIIFWFTGGNKQVISVSQVENIKKTDFSAVGTITFDNSGGGQSVMSLVYKGSGATSLTKELVLDAQSICATPTGALPCMAMSVTFDVPFGGKSAIVEGIEEGDKVIVRKLRALAEGETGRPPVIGSTLIPWIQALNLIRTCEVERVGQTHALDVYLTLKDGTEVRTVEPYIDEVFYAVSEAKKCPPIPIATE